MYNKFFCAVIILMLFSTVAFSQSSDGSDKKNKWGMGVGAGLSKLHITQTNWNIPGNEYFDSLNSIRSTFIPKLELLLFYQISLQENVELRPTFYLSFGDGGKIAYDKKIDPSQTINLSNVSMALSIPLLLKLPSTNNRLYVSGGPAFLYKMSADEKIEKQFPIKNFDVLADLAVGFDILSNKIIITPEIKTSVGFTNLYKNNNSLYTNTVEKVRRQSLTLSLLIRDNK